jgi:hypothetical protein
MRRGALNVGLMNTNNYEHNAWYEQDKINGRG